MELAFFKAVVLLCVLSIGGVRGQLDTQIPIGTFSDNSTNTCHDACTALSTTLGSKVHHNTSLPSTLFSAYYTLMQRSAIPLCIIHPTSSQDVSESIKIISQHSCTFAIKSGGHAMFAGGSTAEAGIVLDLHLLNGLQLSQDRETAHVGTGNRWATVYEFLGPWNVTVVGGRVGDVGVGGFLLGGGISFISRRYGWGCDNVRNYEIVLANGTIANISYTSNPDLYFALRGGGKNFGVVTRFDLETHPLLPPMLTPRFTYVLETISGFLVKVGCKLGYCIDLDTFAEGIARLPVDSEDDHDAMGYGIISILPPTNIYAVGTHTIHTDGQSTSPSFTKLATALQKTKTLHSTTRMDDRHGFMQELEKYNPVGVRMSYNTATFKVDARFLKELARIYVEEIEQVRHVKGLEAGVTTQTLARDEIRQFGRNGGNAFGIREEDGPLTILLTAFGWADEKDNELIVRTAQNVIDRAVILGKEMGVHHPFIYQNYAAKSQDVFAGYSVENQERLRRVQREVDPEGVFSRLQPGYFTL
ncbi:hypothetical protein BKA65DRAFT_601182 [Rhexocercosporidium sp. MPI-PUGE-AT-0058]|nr:hypothetical protein BKA65DRAFT_601182 [Rhexocercosporidium sp. MPI-PUGE-AT-0058]